MSSAKPVTHHLPAPGLLHQIQERYGIELQGVPYVGDSLRDLQAGAAQNRFYNELEDWLATETEIDLADGGLGGGEDLRRSIERLARAALRRHMASLDPALSSWG